MLLVDGIAAKISSCKTPTKKKDNDLERYRAQNLEESMLIDKRSKFNFLNNSTAINLDEDIDDMLD